MSLHRAPRPHEWARYGPGPVEGVTQLDARFVSHVFERHSHDTFSIGATTGGVQRFDCRGARHDCRPGDVMLFNPDEPHDGRAGAAEGFRYSMIYIAPQTLGAMLREPDASAWCGHFRWPQAHDPRLARQLLAAVESLTQPAETLCAQALLARALRRALTFHGDAPPPAPPADASRQRLAWVRDFIEVHHDRDLRIEALAALAGLSRAHLTRAFARAFGIAPHAYLNAVRLRRAQGALLRGQPLAEAAVAAGFADQSHFTRRFKGTFGVPPGAWLAQVRPRSASPL
jgi:AraC-like DNA-binding protein